MFFNRDCVALVFPQSQYSLSVLYDIVGFHDLTETCLTPPSCLSFLQQQHLEKHSIAVEH